MSKLEERVLMNGYMDDNGEWCWNDVLLTSPFSKELFHEVDMSYEDNPLLDYDKSYQWVFSSNLGRMTVLDRRTGFAWRDIKTVYEDDGKLWLASGNLNVLESGCKTVGDAIEWVKRNANSRIGV